MRPGSILVILAGLAGLAQSAHAQIVTHPIWAVTPDAEWDSQARAQFELALQRRGLGPIEMVTIERPKDARLSQLLAEGITALGALAYDRAAGLLADAANLARANAGDGLAPAELASLFFHQGMAIQLASGVTYSEPFTAISPEAARLAYLKAATLQPVQVFEAASAYPIVEMSWRLALTEVRRKPTGILTVNAGPRAKVSVDGGEPLIAPLVVPSLYYGEHFIRIEEPGHAPFFTVVNLAQPTLTLDAPKTPFLVYDANLAAGRALAKGAEFALLGQLRLGETIEIDVRLLDARTHETWDASAVGLSDKRESPDLIAAVLRLDERASRNRVAQTAAANGQTGGRIPVALPPARDVTDDHPALSEGWLRTRWPLLTAIGVALGTAVVLGIVVGNDDSPATKR